MVKSYSGKIKEIFFLLVIIGAIVTIFSVSQINWAQNNRLIKLFSGFSGQKISFFDGVLFRGFAGGILGLLVGTLYLWLLMSALNKESAGKLTLLHAPIWLLWFYPLKIYSNGSFIFNQALLLIVPLIVYILAEKLFLAGYTAREFSLKYKSALLVSVFFSSTAGFFGPLQIFLANPNEFYFVLHKLILYLIPLFVVMTLIITRILLLFPVKSGLYLRAMGVIFALSLGFWLQGNVMVWNYGIIDNSKIQWGNYLLFGIIDSSVWIILIISIFIIKPELIKKYVPNISVFFILLQVIFTLLSVIKEPMNKDSKESGFRRFTVDENVEFNFSGNTNVIIFIIDESQADIFQEFIKNNPEYSKIFDGFTYFRNSLSTFPFTSPSVTSILTGDYYDNSIPLQKYIENAFLSHSIVKTLKENNFEVDQFPITPDSVYFDEKIVSNLKKRDSLSELIKEMAYLYDTGLYRYVPHFLKKYIYNDANWLLYWESKMLYTKSPFNKRKWPYSFTFSQDLVTFNPSIRFINDMVLQSQVISNKGIFKFYHIEGMHVPLRFDENFGLLADITYSRVHYSGQFKAMMKLAKMFLEQLKSLGVYDNTLIIIAGDHGSGRVPEMYNNPDNKSVNTGYNTPTFEFYKTRGIPLILAKRFNAKGDLKTSDAPVSLGDIPETIATELGITDRFPGRPIFQVNENEKRTRYYRAFDYENPPGPNFLNPMTEYEVNGNSWLDKSWKLTGRVFRPGKN